MNWKFVLRKKKSLTPREAASKRKLYVFVLCLLFSTIFWLFIKLSQESQASFQKNIIFRNFPEGMTGVSQSDSLVTFTLETTGLRLITESYLAPSDTLFVDTDQLQVISHNGHNVYYMTRDDLHTRLRNAYGDWAGVRTVSPDTVKADAVEATSKILPVRLNADISYEKRFNLYGEITIQPDSVTLRGPKTMLDTIHELHTSHLEIENIRSSIRKDISLYIPSELLKADVKKVMVHIPVEEFTESTITLPIDIECPDPINKGQLRLFPSKVELSYVVALRDYRMVSENMFQVSVTCPHAEPDAEDRLRVRLDKYPSFVDILNVRPSSVDYVILE